MGIFNIESVPSGVIVTVVSAIIIGISVWLLKLFKQLSKNRRLESNMRMALRKCREKTIRFKAYGDGDLAKHFDDVELDANPFHHWMRIDEDGSDRRRDSVVGQKYFALTNQTKNIGQRAATDGTPVGFRAYADDIVVKVDELLLDLFDPMADT
jgi:hypothetical protein